MTDPEIDRWLVRADKAFNVAEISMAMADMMGEDPALTFADFELRLRAIGSKTFLVARPGPPPQGLEIRFFSGAPASHWLWVCLHGEDERNQLLAELGCTVATNLAALAYCGVLTKPLIRH